MDTLRGRAARPWHAGRDPRSRPGQIEAAAPGADRRPNHGLPGRSRRRVAGKRALTLSWPALGPAAVVFAVTDIDDLVLLAAFFGDRRLQPRAIVAGQFIGIGVLTAASVLAAYAALAVPAGWTSLLGLAPLGLGIHKLWQLWRGSHED